MLEHSYSIILIPIIPLNCISVYIKPNQLRAYIFNGQTNLDVSQFLMLQIKYMQAQADSPEKLNTTESILTSLYDRLIKQPESSEHPTFKQNNQQQRYSSSAYKPNHQSENQLNSTQSPILKKAILFTEPNESILLQLRNNSSFLDADIQQKHQHSSDCCSVLNVFVSEKLKKAAKNEYLLQSYREEVEYLKKLSFLQSQEIDKLRRMLRSQHQQKTKQQALQQKRRLSVMDKKQMQKIASNKKTQPKQTSLKLKPAKKNSQAKQAEKCGRKKASEN